MKPPIATLHPLDVVDTALMETLILAVSYRAKDLIELEVKDKLRPILDEVEALLERFSPAVPDDPT